jgi:hypothetical protein
MEQEPALGRRNRRWGSLRNSAVVNVKLSQRAKAILAALRKREPEPISYGAVIEKLVEQHAELLGDGGERSISDSKEQGE